MRKFTVLLILAGLFVGCGPSQSQLAFNRAFVQAWDTASPEKRQELLQLLQLQQAMQAASDADSNRQMQAVELFNQAVGNVNGMYHQAEPVAPVIQTTHCRTNPFNGNVTCTTF